MKLRMESSRTWKSCIGAISGLIEEAVFEFGKDAVKMRAMDPSHVALADFYLPSEAFQEYKVEEPLELGIDLLEMDKVLSRAGKTDEFRMAFEEGANRLELVFLGESRRRFTMPILSLEGEEPPSPEVDHTVSAEVEASAIKSGLKDASLVGDNVTVEASEGKLLMGAESETGRAETEITPESESLRKLEVDEPSAGTYSIDYLKNMVKAAGSKDIVEVNHAKDVPVEINLGLAGGGRLTFVLAPRVETE